MTGETVVRNNTITISDCINRGTVSGDELAYDYILNKQDLYIKTKASQASAKRTTPKYCSFIGGIAGITIDGIMCDNENLKNYDDGSSKSLYETILSGFVSGSSYNIMVKNCSSFMEYNPSNASDIGDETKYKALKYDNFVGGLIGYSKLTAIKDCNYSPTEYNNKNEVPKIRVVENVPQVYVLGNRYVGGVVGCSDLTRFDTPDGNASSGLNNKTYAVTNYNNVIGKRFVGGIAGGVGSGGLEVSHAQQNPQNLDFRNPSGMSAQFISALPGESSVSVNTQILFKNVLNTGVVLCIKNQDTNSFDSSTKLPDGYCGYCGGITGAALSRISNSDNIQSESTKAFALKIVNDGDLVLDYTKPSDATKIVNELVDNSKFGGVRVGGITGYSGSGNKINASANEKSLVDAVVYGENLVGGAIGDISDSNRPTVSNVYPYKSSDNSSGMLVLGQDAVGGLFGGMPHDPEFINDNGIATTYNVIGRYAVGGYVGVHYYEKWTQGRITSSINISGNNTINVFGRCYTGGLVGFTSSKSVGVPDSNKTIAVNNLNVYSDYFAGGYAGAILDDSSSENNIDSIKRVNYGENVSVSAKAFAGGYIGLYSVNEISNNSYRAFLERNDSRYSWIYNLANEKCKYDVDGSLLNTYKDIVAADNSGNSPIQKDSRKEEIVFSDSTDSTKWLTNNSSVSADLFAGGLFGYVPNGLDITVKGFVNNGSILVNDSISANNVAESHDKSADITYSYLGGVIGRVPSGMKIINCCNRANDKQNSDGVKVAYNSKGTYLGGLTEVNAGVISGDYTTDESGNVTVKNYLENKTDFEYSSGGIGAFAGVNGTEAANCQGLIQYCKNSAKVSSETGFAGGITATQGSASTIKYCVNSGEIGEESSERSAGIVAKPSGSDVINHCRNYGGILGQTKYGIAAGAIPSGEITCNLEASGLDESMGTDPVANNASSGLKRNFFISGDTDDATSGSSVGPQEIKNNGMVYYTIDSGDTTMDVPIEPLYNLNRSNATTLQLKSMRPYNPNNPYDKAYYLELNYTVNELDGVYMKDFDIVWKPRETNCPFTYVYDVEFTYLDEDGNERTVLVPQTGRDSGRKVSLYGSTDILDRIPAPQRVKIKKVSIKINYNDEMQQLNGGSANIYYGYVYWTDSNGSHYIVDQQNKENLSDDQGYISFDISSLGGNGYSEDRSYLYDENPSFNPNASQDMTYYVSNGDLSNNYHSVCIDVNSPTTGLDMQKLKVYFLHTDVNSDKFYKYSITYTYLDANLNEIKVTRYKTISGLPSVHNHGQRIAFYDEIYPKNKLNETFKPTKIELKFSIFDSEGNLITDSNFNNTYYVTAITWVDKNGVERKLEDINHKHTLDDDYSKVNVDWTKFSKASDIATVEEIIVQDGEGSQANDHWSKQLYVQNQGNGSNNLVYTRGGAIMDKLLANDFSIDPNNESVTAEQKYNTFDTWFMGFVDDYTTYPNSKFVSD
jgi:hypothetical protein